MYRPDNEYKIFDDRFVAMFKADQTRVEMVVRLFCENKKHFQ